MKAMYLFLILMVFALIFGGLWNSVPIIKDSVHVVLDPIFGNLLNWNLYVGMISIVLLITLITTLVQKYLTDQVSLKKLKEEQKALQEEMKKYKDHPEKLLEFQKKQMEFIPKTFDLTMKPLIFTFIPFVLFFRWFNDYFTSAGNPHFLGFLSWFWFYLILSIILSSILRKVFRVY